MSKKSPSEFLKSVLGRPVIVKLNSGTTYHGILACLDGYMNIAMEQTQEFVNGQLKNTYADTFIRGNNGKQIQHKFLKKKNSEYFACNQIYITVRQVTVPIKIK